MTHPILEIVRESDCPLLNWLHKPGERVRYFKRNAVRKDADWADRWLPISASDAYEIAERHKEGNQ